MVDRDILPNGITCLCEERPDSGFVIMQVHINRGSAQEAAEEQGLTNLMQESCFGGTTTRSREQISSEVESRGGEVEGHVTRLTTSFQSMALTADAENTFAVMSDVLRHPAFAPEEVERAKCQIAQMLVAQEQDPGAQASHAFMENAYAGQGIGRDTSGTQELLASFTPAQIRKKHDELLSDPSGIVISFAGDIAPAQAKELAQKYFGDIPKGNPAAKPQAQFTGGDVRTAADTDQLMLLMGFPAPGSKSEDRFAAMLFEEMVGGGMSTPIFQEFREKRGLVYTAGAQYRGIPGDGTFFIVSGSGKGKAGDITKVTFDILGKVAREGFSQQQMDQARERILRAMDDAQETAEHSAALNAAQTMENGHLVSRAEFEARLRAVTNDDVRNVCIDMLKSGKYALSAVGPLDTLPPPDEVAQMMKDAVSGVEAPAHASAPSLAPAFAVAATAPQPKAGLNPKMTVLENGLKIVTIERPGPMTCGAWVGVGSDNETPHLNGATHMNEHMMFRGSPRYAPGTISKIVEGELGGQLNAETTKDKTFYYFFSLAASALEKITDICGQMIFFANIDEKEYSGKEEPKGLLGRFASAVGRAVRHVTGKMMKRAGERNAVFEEMRMGKDDVVRRLIYQLDAAAYPDQPHGRTTIGTQEGLEKITAKELRDYRDDFYTPNNVVFCAAGPIRHEDFVALVKKKYGDLKPGKVPDLPVPVWRGGTVSSEAPTATVCNVAVAAEGVSATDPDLPAYQALCTLLSDGDSSVMHREIVDRLALSPHAEAGMMTYRNGGSFLMDGIVAPENVKPFINEMYKLLRGVADNVTEADLDKVKAVMEAEIRTGLETNHAICTTIAAGVQAFGRIVTPEEMCEAVRKLTVADIQRVAHKILECNPAASMVVPPGTDPSLLPTQEEVIAMRDGAYMPPAAMPKPPSPSVSPSAP